jgi:crotonobetainyl-CoA:carnitine CoA-transferase CaiB-like acyl-CoA transferase
MIERAPNPDYGELLLLKSPHNFSRTPPRIPGPASRLGEHNEQVLRDLCGYSAEKIQGLRAKGIVVEDKRAKG